MEDAKTPDEQPKSKIAKQVVSPNRQYFVPAHGASVNARSAKEAVTKAKAQKTTESNDAQAADAEKEGDG